MVLGKQFEKQNGTNIIWLLLSSFDYKIKMSSGKNWPVFKQGIKGKRRI